MRYLLTCLILLSPLSLLSQASPEFGEVVEVHLIPLQVLVRDAKGKPVFGLTKDDFIVYEDNKEQVITHFAEIRQRIPQQVFSSVKEKPAEEAPSKPATLEDIQERYFFYIDNLNIHPLQRNRVLNDLITFVRERIKPGIKGMVISFSRSLKIETPLTDDVEQLIQAIEAQKEHTGEGLQRISSRQDVLERVKEAKLFSQKIGLVRGYAATIYNEMVFTLQALQDMLLALKGLKGRKVLLYVSSGLPETPGYELFYYLAGEYPQDNPFIYMDQYNLNSKYKALINLANSASVNLCMMDVSGLRALSGEGIAETRYGGTELDYTVESHNLTDPLKLLAEETGGVAIVNTNDFKGGFQKIADVVDNYYFIGYQRSQAFEDRYHQIQVKLRDKKKHYVLSYKKGYLEKSLRTSVADRIIANLIFPEETNPLGLTISFQQPRLKEEGVYILPMILELPYNKLTLLKRGDRFTGKIRIGFVAKDARGDRSEVAWKEHAFNIPEDIYEHIKDGSFKYQVELLIRGGGHRVSVGVVDELSTLQSYQVEEVYIQAP